MMIEPMRRLLVMVVVVIFGCRGGDDSVDAGMDMSVVALDCPSYCNEIRSSCTGSNAQYPDDAHCMATCASFEVGASTVTDSSGNTLGCRIYHASTLARSMPGDHCAAAGPAGGSVTMSTPGACSGDDVCESFCTLQIKACGSLEAPLFGDPRDETGNPLFQYRDMESCMTACAAFDKTHAYSTASRGDSLACRLLHATSAAMMTTARAECRYTGPSAEGPCAGRAVP